MKIEKHIHQGKRKGQQDALEFVNGLFVVCDGVGGIKHGDVASKEITQYLSSSYIKNPLEPLNKESIQESIQKAQKHLNGMLKKHPEYEGMGTTLTAVYKSDKVCFLCHIGDSRIYYIKPKEKQYYRTKDHALVDGLFWSGHITEAEAREHPMRNRISKAIQSNLEEKTVKAEILRLDSMEQGDILLICSDGVIEAFTDKELLEILINDKWNLAEKKDTIANKCKEVSKDNNTFYLLELEEKDAFHTAENMGLKMMPLASLTQTVKKEIKDTEEVVNPSLVEGENEDISPKRGNELMKMLKIGIVSFVVLMVGFYIYQTIFSKPETTSYQ